jgi:hypothetical protein
LLDQLRGPRFLFDNFRASFSQAQPSKLSE